MKLSQRKLKKIMDVNGNICIKNKSSKFELDSTTGFHSGGFAFGLLVGLLGVLIAYLIKDEKKKNRVKWAWIGLS